MDKISQDYRAGPDRAPRSGGQMANYDSLEINNHCVDIACHSEYTNVPKGVHSAVTYWTAKSCMRGL